MNRSMVHDIGAYVRGAPGVPNTSLTAAGGGDNSEVTGPTYDREAHSDRLARSAVAIIQMRATLASGETATVAANFQDSDNDSDWTDYGDALAATVVIDAAGGAVTAGYGVTKLKVDLGGARRYVRLQVTPDLSAGATDTGELSAVLVVGGYEELPTS